MNTTSSPVHVILNASAGTTDATQTEQQRLVELFRQHGVEPHILLVQDGRDIGDLVRQAVQAGSQTIVAGGGDGTINAVASALVDTDVALGILPLGTLNHFAKDLGIPLDIAGAVQTILNGRVVHVDVGDVNGRIFINNSSLGLYPSIVRHRLNQQKRYGRGKWLALLLATLTVLPRHPFFRVALCLDGTTIVRRTPFVFVGNNVYQMDALNLGARTELDAGTLSLYTAQPIGRFGLLKLVMRLLLGQLHGRDDFSAFTAQDMVITIRRNRVRVATDGEPHHPEDAASLPHSAWGVARHRTGRDANAVSM